MNDTKENDPPGSESIILGGGCFWCLEAVFERLRGVHSVVSGYAGGEGANPSYEAVCSGTTGHAEVVRIVFDPQQVALATLFDVYFATHDPTTRDRQGNDIGSQYRSVIFCASAAQREAATAALVRIDDSGIWGRRAVTELADLSAEKPFWPAETHHQHYYAEHSAQPYCRAVVAPKVSKVRHSFAALLRPDL